MFVSLFIVVTLCYCSLHYISTQFNVKLSLTLETRVNHNTLNSTKNSQKDNNIVRLYQSLNTEIEENNYMI